MKQAIQIDLNLTNNCNFHCRHCGFHSGEIDKGEMPLSLIKNILTDFKKLGGIKVDLTGGEPVLANNLEETISWAQALGLATKLVTNGALLNAHRLKKLKTLGLKGISFSLDGSTYESFRQTRPTTEKCYRDILHNIKSAKQLGFFVKINTVIFRDNLAEIENIIQQAISFKVDAVRFCFFSPLGRGEKIKQLAADPLAWLKIVREILPLYAKKIALAAEIPFIETTNPTPITCLAKNLNFLQIFPNGDAFPCSIMAAFGQPIVNLNQTSLADFWPEREKFAEEYQRKNIEPLFKKNRGCVAYDFPDERYSFVCPCRKFVLPSTC
jgi:MoaA/NifB/PqqE/SkfB family radical SAM enzyme